jgi:hypothetical protein
VKKVKVIPRRSRGPKGRYEFSKKMMGFSFLEGVPNKNNAEGEPAGALPST